MSFQRISLNVKARFLITEVVTLIETSFPEAHYEIYTTCKKIYIAPLTRSLIFTKDGIVIA